MKNILTYTIAPVLALLAVGCTTPTAMQSTEYDDMYYSSADKTVFTEPEVQTYEQQAYQSEEEQQEGAGQGEIANPEYSNQNAITQNYSGDEYYDGRSYDARNNWYQPNYSYVDPSWGRNYVPSYSSRYSYFYNDPFYDPFYHDPFHYDPFMRRGYWNSGLSVSIGFHTGWGRYPYYSSWYPNNSFYHGYYRGFYDGYYSNPYRYYGSSNYYYDAPVVYGKQRRVQYGPRDARGGTVAGRNTEGRSRTEQRTDAIRSTETGRPARTSRSQNQAITPAGSNRTEARPSRPARNINKDSRGRTIETTQPAVQPQEQRSVSPAPVRQSRPSRQQEYNAPRESRPVQRESRSYESRPTRSYESNTPSRSYETQSSAPSRSNSGNSNSGGGRPRRGN